MFVCFWTDNSLFGSHNGSDSLESKENGTKVKHKVQAASEQAPLGHGLFDDDDDGIFIGSTPKKSSSGKSADLKILILF